MMYTKIAMRSGAAQERDDFTDTEIKILGYFLYRGHGSEVSADLVVPELEKRYGGANRWRLGITRLTRNGYIVRKEIESAEDGGQVKKEMLSLSPHIPASDMSVISLFVTSMHAPETRKKASQNAIDSQRNRFYADGKKAAKLIRLHAENIDKKRIDEFVSRFKSEKWYLRGALTALFNGNCGRLPDRVYETLIDYAERAPTHVRVWAIADIAANIKNLPKDIQERAFAVAASRLNYSFSWSLAWGSLEAYSNGKSDARLEEMLLDLLERHGGMRRLMGQNSIYRDMFGPYLPPRTADAIGKIMREAGDSKIGKWLNDNHELFEWASHNLWWHGRLRR